MADQIASYVLAARALAGARTAVVCAHVDPDGDAVGSVLGMTLILRRLGIDARPALADDGDAPPTYAFLQGFHDFRPAASLDPPPLLVALDTPTRQRLGGGAALAEKAGTVLVMDHHPDNDAYGHINLVDPGAAAVGQMLWRLLPLLDLRPDPAIARCLYVALLTDTGRFQYDNSGPGVLRDAAAMADCGVDVHDVYSRVYENQSLGQLEIVGRVKSRVTLANGGHVAYSWVGEADFTETGAARQATENLVDSIRVLGGVDVVFLARCMPEECRVSLRAKSRADVGAVARRFGGGGHAAAAGFTYPGPLGDLLSELLPLLPPTDR